MTVYAPPPPLRLRRIKVLGTAATMTAIVTALVAFFLPSPAQAAGPLPLFCGSLCSPQAPALTAELAAQGGTIGGTTLSASEATAFQGIVSGYGATATTSGSSIAAAGAAGGSSAWGPVLTGAGVAVLGGGLAAWTGTVGSSDMLGSLPAPSASPTFSYLYNDASAGSSSGTFTGYAVDGSGNVSSVTMQPTSGSSSDGDYGCQIDSIWAASGSMPGSLSAYSSAVSATTVKTHSEVSYGFGNGSHCTGTSAKTFTIGSPSRGSISGAWVLIGFSVNIWNHALSNTFRSYSSVTPGSSSTPTRYVQQTISCTDSSGGSHTYTNSTSAAVLSAGDLLTIAGLMCPTGQRLDSWSTDLKTTGSTDTALGSGSVSHPDDDPCDYVGGSLCTARVTHRVTVGASTTWETCHTAGGACAQWWEDPARDTNYRCEYGVGAAWRVVGIGVCSIYRRTFDPDTAEAVVDPPVPPTVDRNPSSCDMSWSDVLSGAVVFKAVACALEWAFVPSEETLQAVQTEVSLAWADTAPGQIVDAASEVGEPLRGLVDADATPDCLGPEVDWEWGFLPHAHPFSTCSGLPATLATYFRPILGAVALLLGMGQAVRTISSTIGLQAPGSVT